MAPPQLLTRKAYEPLRPEERAAYALIIEQTEAVWALEDMRPSPQDKAIDAAVLDGRVSPEQAHDEFVAYVNEHKTVRGFIESRAWAVR